MKPSNKKAMHPEPTAPGKVLWTLSFLGTVAAAALLWWLCLFAQGGMLARTSAAKPQTSENINGARPPQTPSSHDATTVEPTRLDKEVSDARSKLTGLEGAAGEMSKRI